MCPIVRALSRPDVSCGPGGGARGDISGNTRRLGGITPAWANGAWRLEPLCPGWLWRGSCQPCRHRPWLATASPCRAHGPAMDSPPRVEPAPLQAADEAIARGEGLDCLAVPAERRQPLAEASAAMARTGSGAGLTWQGLDALDPARPLPLRGWGFHLALRRASAADGGLFAGPPTPFLRC